ncbi:hypothetical protein V9T40_003068 [Parthenolecanium corni]|uniref:Autophagy-related protein 16 domain-containing protein n=1 Tax=Parthenolecanium corni TaxID=536013 RepID=A0AAN9TPV8_9HEMI
MNVNNDNRPFDWKNDIIFRVQQRNKLQCFCYQDLINSHNRLFDQANALKSENIQLEIQLERLRKEGPEGHKSVDGNADVRTATNEQLLVLEQKLLARQEELTEIHKKRGENAQMIVDLKNALSEKDKLITVKDKVLTENITLIASLKAEIQMYETNHQRLQDQYQLLQDEHQALQLTASKLEEKLRKTQDENMELVERLKRYKFKDAEKMNQENENFIRKRNEKMQKELEDAAKDMRGLSPDSFRDCGPISFSPNAIPTKHYLHFDAHDGEVNAVKWSPVDRLFATGGADRKVKLWDISKGSIESKGLLVGSSAGVMSVDFDSTGTSIVAASNDLASRVWTVNDQRLRTEKSLNLCQIFQENFANALMSNNTYCYGLTIRTSD